MAVKEIAAVQRYLALASDGKPTSGVIAGARLKETDTLEEYIFDGEAWLKTRGRQKTYFWSSISIPAGGFFSQAVPCSGYTIATAFCSASGNAQVSFRAASPDGALHAWDPLGVMNGASQRASARAEITGMPMLKVIATNDTSEAITADIYVYLGRSG